MNFSVGFSFNLLYVYILDTLPETNSSPMKIPMFPGKYHQNGGFSSQLC